MKIINVNQGFQMMRQYIDCKTRKPFAPVIFLFTLMQTYIVCA